MNLTLSCTVDANPLLDLSDWTWKHNGRIISHGNDLTLDTLTKMDSGIYECIANNTAGVKSTLIEFEVSCKLKISLVLIL